MGKSSQLYTTRLGCCCLSAQPGVQSANFEIKVLKPVTIPPRLKIRCACINSDRAYLQNVV